MPQSGEGHQPGVRDALREQPRVARIDDGVGVAVHDQGTGTDARLPSVTDIAGSGGRLRRQGSGIRQAEALELHEAVDDLRVALDGARGQGVLRVRAQRRLGRHAVSRRDQPDGGGRHGITGRPSRCRAGQDQAVHPPRIGDGQLLRHHSAQARPQHMGPVDAGGIEHGDDIAGHVGHGERPGRAVAVPGSPVVDQHQPEPAAQLPQHRLPPGAVEPQPLDQDQPGPLPVHSATQVIGDPYVTAAGIPDTAHAGPALMAIVLYIASIC